MSVKNIYTELKSSATANSELASFNIRWDILTEMYQISSKVMESLAIFESNKLTMSQYVKLLFGLLNWALESPTEDDFMDSDDESISKLLKEQLAKVMTEYIWGTTQIKSRVSNFALTSYFMDYENTSLHLQETRELAEKSTISIASAILEHVEKSSKEWPNIVDKVITDMDSVINTPVEDSVTDTQHLSSKIAKRMRLSGLPQDTVQAPSPTIANELVRYRNFGQNKYINCK